MQTLISTVDGWGVASYLLATLGIAGVVGLIALAIFAPAAIGVIAEWLKALAPLVRGLAEGIVWFVKTMWEGLKDMTDNAASIVFVLVLVVASSMWVASRSKCDCDTGAAVAAHERSLRQQYNFVPKTSRSSRPAQRLVPAYRPAPTAKPVQAQPTRPEPQRSWLPWTGEFQ